MPRCIDSVLILANKRKCIKCGLIINIIKLPEDKTSELFIRISFNQKKCY